MEQPHRAGFVSIIGRPNVGKSTLMNGLVGEDLSVITHKAQTTRHRIMGILSGDNFQIVYSDTPGLLIPKYALHHAMMGYVKVSLEDADLILVVVDPVEMYDDDLKRYIGQLKQPIVLVLNKIDSMKAAQIKERTAYWSRSLQPETVIPASALKRQNMDLVLDAILARLPNHPAYYAKEELTNRSERFFVTEIIREKIFLLYSQEVPYSVEVVVDQFDEKGDIIHIHAFVFVERDSQKGILVGKRGDAIKRVGIAARKDMEKFFSKKVFLAIRIKVAKDWRKNRKELKKFGYIL